MKLIYGTGNPAKLKYMERALKDLPIEISGVTEAAAEKGITIPQIEETGNSPLENAKIKAQTYYNLLKRPVFSCDSGLYLWNYKTGKMLPEEEQPGIHVRGRGDKRLTDEELIIHYTGLVQKYGPVLARYKNGICLVMDETHIYESMDESMWGETFLFTDKPHPKRISGFPLDSISLEVKSGKYFYDLEGNSQDDLAAEKGIKSFFQKTLKIVDSCDK